MVTMFHRKIRVDDDFDISKVVISWLQTSNMENGKKIRRRGFASIVGRR